MKKETFEVKKQDGRTIRGVNCIPEDGFSRHPVILFSHGFGGNYVRELPYAEYFIRQGIAVAYFDFCGGGPDSTSDGDMEDMSVLTEVEDLETVLAYVRKLPFVDTDHLYLLGVSQGGYVSAYTAAEQDGIAGLILFFPAFVIPDDARKRLDAGITVREGRKLGPHYDTDAVAIDIYEKIKGYRGPVLILQGDKDRVVPYSYAVKAAAVYENAVLIDIYGAGHGFEEEELEQAADYTIDFIENGPDEMCPQHSVLLTEEIGRFYYIPPFSYRKEDVDRIDAALIAEAKKMEGRKRFINKEPLIMRSLAACGIAMGMDLDTDEIIRILVQGEKEDEMSEPGPIAQLAYAIADLRTFVEIFRKKGDHAFAYLKDPDERRQSQKYHDILNSVQSLQGNESYEELAGLVNEIFGAEPSPLSMEDFDEEDCEIENLKG